MLWRALRGVERGYYIDVGAAEPEVDSVTYAFYQRGWRGVNLEPARGAFERLSVARPDDINLNLAVADRNGVASFYMVDGGNGLSTIVPDQRESLRDQGWDSTETHIPALTLASIIAEHVNGTVHFLKIDVEGSERAVLAGADLHHFRPWIILVEATAPNSQVPTHMAWEGLLLEADYRFVWFDGLNRFYVAAEKAELAAAFQVQPNVFDGFVRYSEFKAKTQLVEATSSLAEAILREQAAETELALQYARAKELAMHAGRLESERDAWMQELFEVNRHAAYLTQNRQALMEKNQQLESEKTRFHNHVLAMYASTSWKFARPVRAIARLLGRR